MEKVNATIEEKIQVQQWKNTKETISWFNKIEHKASCKFIQCDIVDFYPSITEELLNKAIIFAKNTVHITDKEFEIIMHAKKSLLFNEDSSWVKMQIRTFTSA